MGITIDTKRSVVCDVCGKTEEGDFRGYMTLIVDKETIIRPESLFRMKPRIIIEDNPHYFCMKCMEAILSKKSQ